MHGGERRILNYWLGEELGHDRLGRVFRAEEARANRTVVLRLLRVASVAPADRVRETREALRRRIRAASGVVHANLPAVLDFAPYEDLDVLVFEDIQGETMMERAARGALLPLDEVLWHATQLAAALEGAHARGIAHGRITPANVRVARDGRARLLDLGVPRPEAVAKALPDPGVNGALATLFRSDLTDFARTIRFMVVGSEQPDPAEENDALAGLGGDIVRAVEQATGNPAAAASSIRIALVELARRTPADAGILARPDPRPPVARRWSTPRQGTLDFAGMAAPPRAVPADIESEAPAPTPAWPDHVAASGSTRNLFVPGGKRSRRHAHGEERGAAEPAAPLLVSDKRKHRRSLLHRLATTLRLRRDVWGESLARLRSPSTAQYAASAAIGALLVLLGVALVDRPGGATPPAGAVQPGAELASDGGVGTPVSEPPVGSRLAAGGPAVPASTAARTGSLRMSVTPRGAVVSLDGGPWRPAPVSFIELPAGEHVVRIRHDSFDERSITVDVPAGQTTRRTVDLRGR